ncbi:phospholipid scramblase 2 isoform X2 [Fukomys damarensis]|uniref:phospholipid scramblase 2 isoform X2 n=1 Tax=Fukomys damarensis TaxID=885580 RepID=UPI00053FAFBC|nr:phospholipid scramblase 2 isoform X2 [Fukomys damarensis]
MENYFIIHVLLFLLVRARPRLNSRTRSHRLLSICVIQIMDFYDLQPAIQWMSSSETIPNSPPALEHLAGINQLIVCQRFDSEVFGHLKTSKTYEVMNNQGQRIYFAEERNNRFLLYLCGISRPFTMTIYGNVGQDIITMNKALRCSCCWSSCCLQKLTVEAPPGEKIGYVYQYFHPFLPKFKIKNENKKDVLKIRGPCLVSNCLWDLNFNLLSLDEEIVIGNISKHCSGFVTAPSLTDADTFSIQFPIDLDVKNKALILGASFLIHEN